MVMDLADYWTIKQHRQPTVCQCGYVGYEVNLVLQHCSVLHLIFLAILEPVTVHGKLNPSSTVQAYIYNLSWLTSTET